ncbi:MAG: phosphomannomutase/phosphoglucomutase [Thiohalomonadales bacterium]
MTEHTNSSIDTTMFKAYDIRGIVDVTLTEQAARQIGQALGSEAKARGEQHIYVAYDGRLSGPRLSDALVEGLLSTGCDVTNIGMVPTPVLYFAAYSLGSGSGVMVTGSHNPPEYNGLKMVLAGDTLAGDDIQALLKRIQDRDVVKDQGKDQGNGQGKTQQLDVVDDYIRRISSDVSLTRKMKVIVDCGNGVAGEAAPKLLRALGCEVEELFCEIDGNFPNHHPDPSQPENLVDLQHALKDSDADIGLAFDGDGDRLGVITKQGNVIWADRQMMLYAKDVLSRNPGAEIIYDIKCTRHLEAEIVAAGGKATMWKTGHSFIKAKLKQSGALLAGEMSGHIFFKERWFGFDDALYTAARLLEILARDSRDAETLFAEFPDSVNTPEIKLKMPEGEHYLLIEKLVNNANFGAATLTTIDGIRADFDDGFGLVRASNTTPCLVFRFEGEDQAALDRIQSQFRDLVREQTAGAVEIPF